MSLTRSTIGWLVLFMWGFAYIQPIVATVLCAVWIYDKRWRAVGPFAVGGAVVWLAYEVM